MPSLNSKNAELPNIVSEEANETVVQLKQCGGWATTCMGIRLATS